MTQVALRLFVAVDVPAGHLEAIDRALGGMELSRDRARFTSPEGRHVTLQFLGATPSDRLEAVSRAIASVADGQDAAPVALGALGAFPSRRRARVLWAGLDDPEGLLGALAAGLGRTLEPLGYPREARAFTPHVTLARYRTPARLDHVASERPWDQLPRFTVSAMKLYRSRLHPRGARYEVLSAFPLRPRGAPA